MALRSHFMLLLLAILLALALGEGDGCPAHYPATTSSASTFSTTAFSIITSSSSGSATSTIPLPISNCMSMATQVAPPACSSSLSNASADSSVVYQTSTKLTAIGGRTLQAPQPDDSPRRRGSLWSKWDQYRHDRFYSNGGSSLFWPILLLKLRRRQSVRAKQLSGTGQYASRFMKVQAGSYNLVYTNPSRDHIDVTCWLGGWTLDLRGVTISSPLDSSHKGNPNPAIYVSQADPTFTFGLPKQPRQLPRDLHPQSIVSTSPTRITTRVRTATSGSWTIPPCEWLGE